MRVLVLGATGMLGSTLVSYLRGTGRLQVAGTSRKRVATQPDDSTSQLFPLLIGADVERQLAKVFAEFQPDFLINCAGVINVDCRDDDPAGVAKAVEVNASFPHRLNAYVSSQRPQARVIHITTDCVYSGTKGRYTEGDVADPVDFYAQSKLLGEVKSLHWLNLRCSIIGPNPTHRRGLLEWVRSHAVGTRIPGFQHHHWNGVTTLQFAQYCEEIILDKRFEALRGMNHTLHYCPNERLSKCELVEKINEVFACRLHVDPVQIPGPPIDRSLASNYLPNGQLSFDNVLADLREFENASAGNIV